MNSGTSTPNGIRIRSLFLCNSPLPSLSTTRSTITRASHASFVPITDVHQCHRLADPPRDRRRDRPTIVAKTEMRRDEMRGKRWTRTRTLRKTGNEGGKRERRFSLRGERQKSGEGEEEREEFAARTGASFQFGVALLKGEGKFTARVGRVKIYYWSWNGPRLRGPRTEQRTVKLRRKSNNDGPPRCGRETARPVLSE